MGSSKQEPGALLQDGVQREVKDLGIRELGLILTLLPINEKGADLTITGFLFNYLSSLMGHSSTVNGLL